MLLVAVRSAWFTCGNLEVLFTSFTSLRCVIRDHFGWHLSQSQVPGLPESLEVVLPGDSVPVVHN